MSERMNKERAIEILKSYLEEYKTTLQEYEDKNIPHDKGYIHHKETLQALDIAIESLEDDIQQKGIELMAKTIGRKHYYPMPTLFKNDNIKKYTATEVNALIDSIADDIKKIVVEPYERKE